MSRPADESRLLKEGHSHMMEATKALRKNLFKWTVDWDVASFEFEKAGHCFKAAGHLQMACEAFEKAADAHLKSDGLFLAAKHYELAAQLAKSLSHHERCADLYERASKYYRTADAVDRAGDCLLKAATEFLEVQGVEKAAKCCSHLFDLLEEEERERFGLEHYKKAVSILFPYSLPAAMDCLTRWKKAAIRLEMLLLEFRILVCIVVILVLQNDVVEATKRHDIMLRSISSYGASDEAKWIALFLEAYEQRSADLLSSCVQNSLLSFIGIPSITKALKSLKGKWSDQLSPARLLPRSVSMEKHVLQKGSSEELRACDPLDAIVKDLDVFHFADPLISNPLNHQGQTVSNINNINDNDDDDYGLR